MIQLLEPKFLRPVLLLWLAGLVRSDDDSASTTPVHGRTRIVGGNYASTGEYPFYVKGASCGGSLIAPRVVLTAAHCPDSQFRYVRIGSIHSSFGGEVIIVEKQIEHPNYNGAMINDFKILILSEESQFTPIELNSDDASPAVDDMQTVIGMGYNSEDGQMSNRLEKAEINYISNEVCSNKFGISFVADVMMCAMVDNDDGGVDACQGDSGGSLIDKTTGKQVGVVSWGVGCARAGVPGVYSRVSSVYPWIQSQISLYTESIEDTFDVNKRYFLDVLDLNVRLAANGSSRTPYVVPTSTTGDDVEWMIVKRDDGYYHIQRAAGGTNSRLRTQGGGVSQMVPSQYFTGINTYYDITEGDSDVPFAKFLTLPDGPDNMARLRVDRYDNDRVMFTMESSVGTWVSFSLTPVCTILTKSALNYAIDGGDNSSEGQNLRVSVLTADASQQWQEIYRGDGYYSYQKAGTTYSMDGGNDNSRLTLGTTDANNYNQHWQKVHVDDDEDENVYKLVKRDTDVAVMNAMNGTISNNVNLSDASSSKGDIQWVVT